MDNKNDSGEITITSGIPESFCLLELLVFDS